MRGELHQELLHRVQQVCRQRHSSGVQDAPGQGLRQGGGGGVQHRVRERVHHDPGEARGKKERRRNFRIGLGMS